MKKLIPPPIKNPRLTSDSLQNHHKDIIHKDISCKTCALICLILFAFLLTLNVLLPLVGDDYLLLKNSNGIASLIYSYKSWNARIYELLYGAFIVRLNPYLFDFINAILGVIFILGLHILLFWDFRRKFNVQDIFLLITMLFLLCTTIAFEAVFLWGDGSVNYLWGGVGVVLIMIHIKIFLLQRFGKKLAFFKNLKSKIAIFLLLILSLTSAMSNETLCVFMILAYTTLFIALKIHKIKSPIYYKISFALIILGLLYLITAPGTNARIATEIARYDYMSLGEIWALSLGEKMARIFVMLSHFATKTPMIALIIIFSCAFFRIYTAKILYKKVVIFTLSLCLFCTLLVQMPLLGIFTLFFMQLYIYRTNPNSINLIILVSLCAWILMGLSYLQFAKNLPLRARSIDLVMLICICLLYLKTYIFSKKFMLVLGGAMIAFFAYTIYQYADLRIKWNALCKYVESQKSLYGENAQIVYELEKFKIDYFMIGSFFKPNNDRYNKKLDYFGFDYVFGVKSMKFE